MAEEASLLCDGVAAMSHDASASIASRITADWANVASAVEAELCDICDHVDPHGAPLAQYTGRAAPLRLVQRPLLPPRLDGPLGRVDRIGHAARWVGVRIQELAHLADQAHRCYPREGGNGKP